MSVLKIKDDGVWKDIPAIVGEAAGFGTVTATVDTNVGTPTVTVTSSGEDTAKNFAFAFQNLGYDDSDLQSDFADLADDFDILQGQFDTAVAALTVDSEVQNIRVGDDGVTYTSAGEAVRTQFSDVKAEINQYLLLGVIVENSYVKTDGGFANYSGWSRTDYIDISEFCAIKMKSSVRSIYNVFYDANKDPIISFTYGTADTDVIIPSNAKYMVLSNTSSGLSNTTGKYTRKSDRIDAIESNLNQLIEIKTSTRVGYYGSGGAFIDEQDPTMLEVSTYPIDVEPNQVLKFSIKYPQLQSTWGAYCIYEKDGTFISRTVFMNDYYQVFKGEITIPNDAYHIIFMYRSYGTAVFKLSSVAEVIDIYDTAKDNTDFISIPLTYTNGYIDPYGGYAVPTSAKEVYTNKIPVVAGMKLKVGLKFTKPQANWFCYCCYDRSGNFISRTLIAQYTWVDFSTEITVPQNACEILFTFRTYDDATFKVYYESLYKVIADINKYKDYMDVPVNPVKGINHRGWYEAPEDTLVAYKQSRTHGFGYVETDVRLTSDGVPVLLHDTTINRTGRNADGTTISGTVYIKDITYAEAQTYDFGIYKGAEYEGTEIPKFEDFIKLCKNIDVHPYIEIEHDATFTQSDVQNLIDIVRRNGMKGNVTFISFSTTYLGYVTAYDSSARVGYIVSNDIADADITATNALKTANNEVFIDARYDYLTSTGISKCYNANIPLEVWCPDTVASITALDPYIVGVTSNKFVASKVLFDANI